MPDSPDIDIRAFRERPLIESAVLLYIVAGKPDILHHAPGKTEILLVIFHTHLLFQPFFQIRT